MLLSETFSEIFTTVDLRPGLVILLTLRLIQEQIKYCAFTRHKVIVIKETWITQFPFFLKFLMEINFTLNTNFHF